MWTNCTIYKSNYCTHFTLWNCAINLWYEESSGGRHPWSSCNQEYTKVSFLWITQTMSLCTHDQHIIHKYVYSRDHTGYASLALPLLKLKCSVIIYHWNWAFLASTIMVKSFGGPILGSAMYTHFKVLRFSNWKAMRTVYHMVKGWWVKHTGYFVGKKHQCKKD